MAAADPDTGSLWQGSMKFKKETLNRIQDLFSRNLDSDWQCIRYINVYDLQQHQFIFCEMIKAFVQYLLNTFLESCQRVDYLVFPLLARQSIKTYLCSFSRSCTAFSSRNCAKKSLNRKSKFNNEKQNNKTQKLKTLYIAEYLGRAGIFQTKLAIFAEIIFNFKCLFYKKKCFNLTQITLKYNTAHFLAF